MKRSLAAFALLFFAACATSRTAPQPVAEVDPRTEPTVAGAVDEAVWEGVEGAAKGAAVGRFVGRFVGVLAAVGGGGKHDTIEEAVDRYHVSVDIGEALGAVIGGATGANAGARRGFEFDLQFKALHDIEGILVTRPFPDQMDVRIPSNASDALLADVAAVFAGREDRAIDVEARDDVAFVIREVLIEAGVPSASVNAHRNDDLDDIVLRVRYR